MTTLPTIAILAVLATAAQPDEPWKTRFEAAGKALADGDAPRAEAIFTGIVRDAEKLGDRDPRLAYALKRLAYFQMIAPRKRYDLAEPMLVRALAIREQTPGPNRAELAATLIDLAMLRLMAKRVREAIEPILRRALEILDRRGQDDAELSRALRAMATYHLMRKEFDQAEPLFVRALAIRRKVYGPESVETARLLDDFGNLTLARAQTHRSVASSSMKEPIDPLHGLPAIDPFLKAVKDYHQAIEQVRAFHEQALAIREKTLGPTDPSLADSLLQLGKLAIEQEHPKDSIPYLKRWLAIEEKRKAPPSKERAEVRAHLARTLQEQKDWPAAEEQFLKAQEELEAIQGPEGSDVAMLLSSRADLAVETGRFDDAARFLHRALQFRWTHVNRADGDLYLARQWTSESYLDHLGDRRAPVLWHRLKALKIRVDRPSEREAIEELLWEFAELLRQSNRVLPPPTREDLDELVRLSDGLVRPRTMAPDSRKLNDFIEDRLDDVGLAHVGRLYDLESLEIRGRGAGEDRTITGAGIAHLQNLINLRKLSIRGAEIDDVSLAALADLEYLEELDLSLTPIGDAGLAHLEGLKSLRTLHLSATNVTDAGLAHLERLPALRRVLLNSTRVTDAGLDRLRDARPGIEIDHSPGPGYRPIAP